MFSSSRGFLRSSGLLVLAVGLVQPANIFGQAPGCVAPPVQSCGAPATCCAPPTCCPPAPCCAPCPPPDICTCTTFKPVCDTTYRTQQCVGYHQVCKTCYRQEPYCVTVPVTKVNCVTVDEGCYKMVWCPRPVVKQIPYTEYHQQVCSRTVPYTVTQCVPHVTTQVIPECHVRYVPCTHTYLKPPCVPCAPCSCCPTAAPTCGARSPCRSRCRPAASPRRASRRPRRTCRSSRLPTANRTSRRLPNIARLRLSSTLRPRPRWRTCRRPKSRRT